MHANIWLVTGNTHGWGSLASALDDIKNEIQPLEALMGQGLVGEWDEGSHTTVVGPWTVLWDYTVPENNPKKVSLWIDLAQMGPGDTIEIHVVYDSDALGSPQHLQDTSGRTFNWVFSDSQPQDGVLIIDELPIVAWPPNPGEVTLEVHYQQTAGSPFTVYYHYIVEEMWKTMLCAA